MNHKTGFVFDNIYIKHYLGPNHPESPQRLVAIKNKMQQSELYKDVLKLSPITDHNEIINAIKKVHSKPHIDSVLSCSNIPNTALQAVSGVLAAVKQVMQGKIKNAFCAVRPPGHHAHNNGAHYDDRAQGQGFCFFNNVAIAARYAQEVYKCKRVLILDWDFHHGNGTEWIFYNDPTVFYFSTHDLYSYPGTGLPDRYGSGKGEGFNLNVPLRPGATDTDILNAWEKGLLPAIEKQKFKPDLLLISAGFDSRKEDFLGNFNITDQGFKLLTKIAMNIAQSYCNYRLISILEGGYNPEGLAKAVKAHIGELIQC